MIGKFGELSYHTKKAAYLSYKISGQKTNRYGTKFRRDTEICLPYQNVRKRDYDRY
ncbi:MAG: hypothetical protein HFI40_02410 [Lachnospiraceae bacterium]|nr:hypothetical protein [Lachnospiraceae bacterium]MCX4315690.1 hypothetical protein [Lachnospiraceae bacterium]